MLSPSFLVFFLGGEGGGDGGCFWGKQNQINRFLTDFCRFFCILRQSYFLQPAAVPMPLRLTRLPPEVPGPLHFTAHILAPRGSASLCV